jgi:hypothetical protein
MRIDGLPVVDSVADLERSEFFYPIRLNEFGGDSPRGRPMASSRCGRVRTRCTAMHPATTAATGPPPPTKTGRWSAARRQEPRSGCGAPRIRATRCCRSTASKRIHDTTRSASAAGRRATRLPLASFAPVEGGSIADADARCAADAAAAHLPGSFKALLADIAHVPLRYQ